MTDVSTIPRHPERSEPRTFDLTDQEIDLIRKLNDFRNNCDHVTHVELRIAGGWVRDKLLGHECHDIDIALREMSGEQFLNHFNKWQVENGGSNHKYWVIRSNPNKSKHLETATTTYGIFSLDFVHLRSESYTEYSRIPSQVHFGTPKEDAFRRDFTINSLFYNLQNDQIEDWTGLGLKDLEKRIIRTPLDPVITLQDDGLRLLRGVRFAATLNFSCDPAFLASAKDYAVRERLKKNVSSQRKGQELEKMLMIASPEKCFDLLCTGCQIHDILFALDHYKCGTSWILKSLELVRLVCQVVHISTGEPSRLDFSSTDLKCSLKTSVENRKNLSLTAFLYPISKQFVDQVSDSGSKKAEPVYVQILSEHLKFKRKDVKTIGHLFLGSDYWCKILNDWGNIRACVKQLNDPLVNLDKDFLSNTNVFIGLVVRRLGRYIWDLSLVLACLVNEVVYKKVSYIYAKEICDIVTILGSDLIFQLPMISGDQLKEAFPKISPKQAIKHMLDYQIQVCMSDTKISKNKLQSLLLKKFSFYA